MTNQATQKPVYSEGTLNLMVKRFLQTYTNEANTYIDRIGGLDSLTPQLQKACLKNSLRAADNAEPYIAKCRARWLLLSPQEKKKELDLEEKIGKKTQLGIVNFWKNLNWRRPMSRKEKKKVKETPVVNIVQNEDQEPELETKSSYKLYKRLADEYGWLPPDNMAQILFNTTRTVFGTNRHRMKKEGYDFEPVAFGDKNKGETVWKVTAVPKNPEEIKQETIEKISSSIDGWQQKDLETLLELVRQNK